MKCAIGRGEKAVCDRWHYNGKLMLVTVWRPLIRLPLALSDRRKEALKQNFCVKGSTFFFKLENPF